MSERDVYKSIEVFKRSLFDIKVAFPWWIYLKSTLLEWNETYIIFDKFE